MEIERDSQKDDIIQKDYKLLKERRDEENKKFENSQANIVKLFKENKYQKEINELEQIVEKIRKSDPTLAAKVDSQFKVQPLDERLSDLMKDFPDFANTLEDSEVFELLTKLVNENELDPLLKTVPETLANRKKQRLQNIDDQDLKKKELLETLDQDIPGLAQKLIELQKVDDDGEDIVLDKNNVSLSEFPNYLSELQLKPFEIDVDNPMTKETFFKGREHIAKYKGGREFLEKRWEKYQELLRYEIEARSRDPTAEEEPYIDLANPEQAKRAHRKSAIGKYLKWNPKDQRDFLPEGWCGKIEEREFTSTKEMSLLFREPSFIGIENLKLSKSMGFSEQSPKNFLFHGDKGVGKSAVLQHVIYWARKNGWLVFNIKSGTKWVHSGGIIQKSKIFPDCWDQPHLGVRILNCLLDTHQDQLKNIPIRTEIQLARFSGKNLFDLVEYGAALHEHSCEVVYYLRNELQRVVEYPVLIAIDDYNSLYNYNQVFRDPECTHFKAKKLKNTNLTLTRTFHGIHKDCKLANGAFVGAISNEQTLRNFDVDQEKNKNWVVVKPYSSYETQKVFDHLEKTQYILQDTSFDTRELLNFLSGGRGYDLLKTTSAL